MEPIVARPKEFEPEEALEKAMRQFWTKGYHDTSIRDLVERTGVNYYGLYGEFDSKHGLFLAALDHYQRTVTAEALGELRKPGPIRRAIARTFERLAKATLTPDGRVGCLMCNTAVEMAPSDPEAAEKFKAHTKMLRDAFRTKLAEGQQAGELAADKDVGALAEFLATTVYSAGFLTRSGFGEAYVARHLRTALTALG